MKLPNERLGAYTAAIGHIHEHRQILILGDPGSGKSTLLRYVALCLCNALQENATTNTLKWNVTPVSNSRDDDEQTRTVPWQLPNLVPIFIQLRDYARQLKSEKHTIWQYVCEQLPDEIKDENLFDTLHYLAKHNLLLFMFDGVDEVPPKERKHVWSAIGAFMQTPYGSNRWIATCRVLSFVEAELPRRHLPVVTLQTLNSAQIDLFVDSWYRTLEMKGELSHEDAQHKTRALQAASRAHLQELATNPMLLTIMAIVQTYEGTLPDERALLYQRCVETLLLRWQRSKDEENAPSILQQLGVSQAQLEQLLWRLGWEAHSKSKDRERAADLPEWDVLKIARQQLGSLEKAEKFLHYTEKKAHLLIGSGGADDNRYTFPHRTFQEYLAACYLESERKPLRKIAKLAEQGDQWREVLNLAFGRLMHVKNDRVKAIAIVMDKLLDDELPTNDSGWRRVWLTGEVCAVIGQETLLEDEEGAEILPQLRDQLVALLQHGVLTPRQRVEAGDALAALGDLRTGVCNLEPDMIPIPVGDFLYGDNRETQTIEQPFTIARYPVTVAQYERFVYAEGYQNVSYWSPEGFAWRETSRIDQPRSWENPVWHVANHPVIGVSWYEANAFCAWLSEQLEREYRLPTEFEWERAARHTDGRKYPWGDDWEDGSVNSSEAQIGRTSTVGAFPRGSANCGAHDLAGNVREWTTSLHERSRVLMSCGAVRGSTFVTTLAPPTVTGTTRTTRTTTSGFGLSLTPFGKPARNVLGHSDARRGWPPSERRRSSFSTATAGADKNGSHLKCDFRGNESVQI